MFSKKNRFIFSVVLILHSIVSYASDIENEFAVKMKQDSFYYQYFTSKVSDDGNYLAVFGVEDSRNPQLLIYDLKTKKELCQTPINIIRQHKFLGFTKDSKRVLVSVQGELRGKPWSLSSYNLRSCRFENGVQTIPQEPLTLVKNSQNSYVSVLTDNGSFVFDLRTQLSAPIFSCPYRGILSDDGAKFLCDSWTFTDGKATPLMIYDVRKGFQKTTSIQGQKYHFENYYFSKRSDGVFYTTQYYNPINDPYDTSYSFDLRYFDLSTNSDKILLSKIDINGRSAEALSPDNKYYILAYTNRGIKIVDLQTKESKGTIEVEGQFRNLSFSKDGKYVLATRYVDQVGKGNYISSNKIYVFEVATGEVRRIIKESSQVDSADFVPNSNDLVIRMNLSGTIRVRSLSTLVY